MKYGDEVEVGDLMVFLRRSHRVVRIEPHACVPGERIATWEDGQSITVAPDQRYEVV